MTDPTKSHLLQRLRRGETGDALIAALDAALTHMSLTPEDVELLLGQAHLAWIADQRAPAAQRARDAALRLTQLVPTLRDGHRLLGLAHLTRGEYRDAFMAFTAAMRCDGGANLENFRALARNLMLGDATANFEIDGAAYTFDLSCHNAAAIEAGAFHSVGVLTELDELRALKSVADRRSITGIIEIGVLMGNHTAYFLKAFTPRRIMLIDADPANLPFIARTVQANATTPPELALINAFVGAQPGQTTFAGHAVACRRLDDLAAWPADLLKIDVDGGELALLSGAEAAIMAGRPLVMIETTPATRADALAWFAARGYDARQTFDHGAYANTILVPGP